MFLLMLQKLYEELRKIIETATMLGVRMKLLQALVPNCNCEYHDFWGPVLNGLRAR